MLKTICYLSTSEFDVTDESIKNIFELSVKSNKENNITGLLIYNQRNFLGVIEGGEQVVNDLFVKIEKDKRHKNIITVANSNIDQRFFGHFNSGFTVITSMHSYDTLKKHLEKIKTTEDTSYKKICNVIDNFIKIYYNI